MPSNYGGVAVLKGLTRKQQKARETREARKVVTAVRAHDVERDGHCRVGSATDYFGLCWGESQWCHLWSKKRSMTRGLPPEERHSTIWTCQMCARHHEMEERGELVLQALTSECGANGTLRATWNSVSVLLVPRAIT